MATLLIPEIFEQAGAVNKKEDKKKILLKEKTPAMQTVLYMTFHPGIQFEFTELPEYKSEVTPTGMAMNSLYAEAKRLYIFRKDYKLDAKRKMQILLQILESVDAKEADLIGQIFKKELKYKGLTYEFISETFPEFKLPKRD